MQSILTVVTPATTFDLTALADVKLELGITGTTEDATLAVWINQASAACAAYCNRVFAQETVAEVFRNRTFHDRVRREQPGILLLDRFPVSIFTSVVEDTVTLVQNTDYECDPATGRLYRLSDDELVDWNFDKLAVTYSGGFASITAMPFNVQRACITLVKMLRADATRDPSLKSENILSGLYSYQLFGASDMPDGLPGDVQALLAPFRNVSI